jgi:hypothetical protein
MSFILESMLKLGRYCFSSGVAKGLRGVQNASLKIIKYLGNDGGAKENKCVCLSAQPA